ncbi:hypothetical protein GJAV_G00116000 [Gymnothorax javanicus]|nr:hypothetical protein GJAV_G00116000 [Gymnothorax javanicus]
MRVILTDAVRNEHTAAAFLLALRDEDPFLFNDLETNGPRKTFVRSRPPTELFDLWSANRGLRNFFETRRDEFNVVDILVECNLLIVEENDDIRLARERPLFLVLHEIMTLASPEHVVFLECLEGLYRDVWPSLDMEVISQDDTHQQRINKTFSGHGNYDIIDVNSAMTPKATVEDVWWCPICTIHRAEHAFGCGHVTCATYDGKTGNKCPLCRRRKEKVYKEAFAVKNAHMQCPECKGPKMVLIYDGPNGEGCHHVACECAIKNHSLNCIDWHLLPLPTSVLLTEVSAVAKGRFVGDPSFEYELTETRQQGQGDEAVKEEFTMKVTEEKRLAATIFSIERDVSVVPRGAFIKTTDDTVQANRSFQGLSTLEAGNLSNYLHFAEPQHLKKKSILQMADLDPSIDFLDPLSEDIPKGSWSLQMEGSNVCVLRSLLWLGLTFYHVPSSPQHGYIYMGDGLKNLDLPFML